MEKTADIQVNKLITRIREEVACWQLDQGEENPMDRALVSDTLFESSANDNNNDKNNNNHDMIIISKTDQQTRL